MRFLSKPHNEVVTSTFPAALIRFSLLTIFATATGTVMVLVLSTPANGFSWSDSLKTVLYIFLICAVSTAAGSLIPTLMTGHATTFRDWYLVTLAMALTIALTDNPALSWKSFLDSLVINLPLPLLAVGLAVLAFSGLQTPGRTPRSDEPLRLRP